MSLHAGDEINAEFHLVMEVWCDNFVHITFKSCTSHVWPFTVKAPSVLSLAFSDIRYSSWLRNPLRYWRFLLDSHYSPARESTVKMGQPLRLLLFVIWVLWCDNLSFPWTASCTQHHLAQSSDDMAASFVVMQLK